MRISDWSSDVCSSDLKPLPQAGGAEVLASLLGRRSGEGQRRRRRAATRKRVKKAIHDRQEKTQAPAPQPTPARVPGGPLQPPPPTPPRPDPRRTRRAGPSDAARRQMDADPDGQEGAGGGVEPAQIGKAHV